MASDHGLGVSLPLDPESPLPFRDASLGELQVLGTARAAGIGVLVNQPLGALATGARVRCADQATAREVVPLAEASGRVLLREAQPWARFAPALAAEAGGMPSDPIFR